MNHAAAHKHYSYEFWLRIWNPDLFLISTRGLAGALPVPAKGGHVGGEGVVGEHQEITAHPLVALDGRERARGGLATAAGGGGGLLRWWRCSGDLPPRLSVREMRSTTRRAMWHIQ